MIRYLFPIAFTASALLLPIQAASWGDVLAAQEGRRRQMAVSALVEDARRGQALALIEQDFGGHAEMQAAWL